MVVGTLERERQTDRLFFALSEIAVHEFETIGMVNKSQTAAP